MIFFGATSAFTGSWLLLKSTTVSSVFSAFAVEGLLIPAGFLSDSAVFCGSFIDDSSAPFFASAVVSGSSVFTLDSLADFSSSFFDKVFAGVSVDLGCSSAVFFSGELLTVTESSFLSNSFLSCSFLARPFFLPGLSSRISEAEIGTDVLVSPPLCPFKVTSISGISSTPSKVSGVIEMRIP